MLARFSALAGALAVSWPIAAASQDLVVMGGAMRSEIPRARSFSFGLSYSHDLGPVFSGTLSYLNEGHVPGHHRDGLSAQLWARIPFLSPQLWLAAGVGPYYYFDTTVAESTPGHIDAHGRGVIASASATWRSRGSPWYYELRVDRTETKQDLDTTMVRVGAGYRLDQDGSFPGNAIDWRRRRHEIWAAAGQTIVNSFESQSSLARSIEYRHCFGPVVRGSIGWLYEGDARLIRRDGIVAQGWLEPTFSDGRFTLGVGYGGYIAVDSYASEGRRTLGIFTLTSSYHVGGHWLARLSWHRIASNDYRDSDIFLLGAGYRF